MAGRPNGKRKHAAPAEGPKKLLLLPEVMRDTRLSETTISRLEAKGRFPKRLRIGFKRVAWRAAEIDAWIQGDGAGEHA